VKKIFYLFILVVFINACDKDQPTQEDFNSYSFQQLDEAGGNWTPILLTNVQDISIPQPLDVNSTEYKNQIEQVKAAMINITPEQTRVAQYWSTNPVLRWNEIARNLAAKYNLIPAPNADGSYPVPDAAKPDQYPLFPFAHPPYTARMLSYLSVASFDAAITVWHNKFKFKAPSLKQAVGVNSVLNLSDLPSYPSHESSSTQVAVEVLSAMFPLEKEYIQKKADEHIKSLIYTGQCTPQDIDAGKIIGSAVAKKALQRASTDGMKAAQTPLIVADSIKKAAQDKWGWSYKSLEIPERKIGLVPKFGKVKPWAVKNVEAIRPASPPALNSKEFQEAAAELSSLSKNLTQNQRKIANFWADGTSTYTPPGHWNRIACEHIHANGLNPLRSARTLAYVNMGIMDAGIACWDVKYYYHYPRPVQAIDGFKSLLGTPNFPGYTSGHSTFSSSAAEILSYIFPSNKSVFDKYAHEASESRIFGGIHFRFDCEKGLEQGKKVAAFTIAIAQKDGAN
jgi:hypothetical protein